MKNVVLSVAFILLVASVCSAQSIFEFPQFVDGPLGGVFWASAIAITNAGGPTTPVASGTITLTGENGTPLNVQLYDENHVPTSNTFQLAGGQTKFFNSPVLNGGSSVLSLPFSLGFATVTSNVAVTGGLVFYEAGTTGLLGEAGVLSSTALMRQGTVVVRDSNNDTGVAVVNPGSGTATLTFHLLDKTGADIVPPVTRALAANNHTSFFVSQLFPSVTSKIYGTMQIISNTPVASTALLFSLGSFATLPIFPLP